jgi:hypothetical protein
MTAMKTPESDVERARRCVCEIVGIRQDDEVPRIDPEVRALASEFAAVRAGARWTAILECATWLENVYRSRAVADDMRNAILSPSPKTEEPKQACGKPYSGGDCRLTRGHAGHCQD